MPLNMRRYGKYINNVFGTLCNNEFKKKKKCFNWVLRNCYQYVNLVSRNYTPYGKTIYANDYQQQAPALRLLVYYTGCLLKLR